MSTPIVPAGSMIVATVLQPGLTSGAIGAQRMFAEGPLGSDYFAKHIVQRLPALFFEARLPETLPPGGPVTFLLQVFLQDGQLLSFHASAAIDKPTPRADLLAAWTVSLPGFIETVGGVIRHTQAAAAAGVGAGNAAHRVH